MSRECQECGGRTPGSAYAVCTSCLKTKGLGRRGPAKEAPTFHVPGEPVSYSPEPVVLEGAYEPPRIEYTMDLSHVAQEMHILGGLCEDLGISPDGNPRQNILEHVEQLREKTEGARPIKGAPPAELEPTRVQMEPTAPGAGTQVALIDLLGRQMVEVLAKLSSIEHELAKLR